MRKAIDRGLSRDLLMDGTEREQTHGQNGSKSIPPLSTMCTKPGTTRVRTWTLDRIRAENFPVVLIAAETN
jgi:hypothetical protein